MDFDIQAEIRTYSNENGLNTMVKLVPTGATGDALVLPITLSIDEKCAIDCAPSGQIWKTPPTWDWAAGDRHVGNMQMSFFWGQSSSVEMMGLEWEIGAVAGGIPSTTKAAVSTDVHSRIRCDTVVNTNPGCVFESYTPTFVMNSKKFPAAAAHAWLVQQRLPGHFGLKGAGEPLTYLGDEVMSPTNPGKMQSQANRDLICPDSFNRNQDATLSPELSSSGTDTWSCDELAFAKSYQSGGTPASMNNGISPVDSGDECLQTYAKKGTDGLWRLYADPNFPLPTWNEKCGRASMSNNQNTQSMSPFPGFRQRNRIMNKDDYWLDVPSPS